MEKCEHCGKQKEDVVLRLNPYAEEIYDVEIYEYMCDECYDQAFMDI